jgi:uncharacterized protein YyaL (SSP411 family)
MTPPARGLPSAALPTTARVALAARADPVTGRFAGLSATAALLFLLDRARDGDDEAARLALSELRRAPGDDVPSARAAAAEAAVQVEALALKHDDSLEKTARGAVDAALAAFGWNRADEDEGREPTDAHGLMVATLARASLSLEAPGYREAASRAGEWVLAHRVDANFGTLLRLDGEAPHPAGLGDYAFLVRGLLELLPATGEKGWLHEAVRLQGEQEARLGDPRAGGYFEGAGGVDKHGADDSFLSGNGIAALNLIDLSLLTGERSYRDRAEAVLTLFEPEIAKEPLAHLTLLRAAQRLARTSSAG